jgi:hypothetical protein
MVTMNPQCLILQVVNDEGWVKQVDSEGEGDWIVIRTDMPDDVLFRTLAETEEDTS